jgi:hypothetical protein
MLSPTRTANHTSGSAADRVRFEQIPTAGCVVRRAGRVLVSMMRAGSLFGGRTDIRARKHELMGPLVMQDRVQLRIARLVAVRRLLGVTYCCFHGCSEQSPRSDGVGKRAAEAQVAVLGSPPGSKHGVKFSRADGEPNSVGQGVPLLKPDGQQRADESTDLRHLQ